MTTTLKALLAATALTATPAFALVPAEVVATYVNIAEASYGDALATAKTLQTAVDAFLKAPSAETQAAAKAAWIAARAPYQQTEAFRFGNAIVDDWEGRVNAWPLDEGLIDYVDPNSAAINEENALAEANVIANKALTIGATQVDATKITAELLAGALHEAEGIDANVATGYHAIEFLLWGQDLNGTEAGAGARPYTDYVQGADCTGGNCDRRAAYLKAATDLLVADLEEMAANFAPEGAAAKGLLADPNAAITAMLTGMGSLSYGELAGERIKLGLMLHDPEEEHDCFSDNTHNSHYYDGVGIRNVYTGQYTRVDGSVISGPSLSDLVREKDADVDAALRGELDASVAALGAVKAAAEAGMAYDQMLGMGNEKGAELINASVEALVTQTRSIERAVKVLGTTIAVEGSDSLDNPSAVAP